MKLNTILFRINLAVLLVVADSGRRRSPFRSEADHRSGVNPISIPD